MYTFLVILILIVCVLLALVVLVQNSKGGGLAANFSAPTQVLGARQSADFIGVYPTAAYVSPSITFSISQQYPAY